MLLIVLSSRGFNLRVISQTFLDDSIIYNIGVYLLNQADFLSLDCFLLKSKL